MKPACCLLCPWNNGSSFYSYKIKYNLAFANVTVFTVISTNDHINNYYWCVNSHCLEIIILGVNVIFLLQFKLKNYNELSAYNDGPLRILLLCCKPLPSLK